MERVVIIGAGIGGLATAARLARAGLDVTVLEAHVYPGGSAGTFYHQGYRFDAGATLAGGFYPDGPMDILARAVGISGWDTIPAPHQPAMVVHLPDGTAIQRWSDDRRWDERQRLFPEAERFWHWQERTADALWDLALRRPPWPPQSLHDGAGLVQRGLAWLGQDWKQHLSPQLWLDAVRPVAAHLRRASQSLRLFVDAQLLISAQTTSQNANALYGAAALDLPRRGVVHVRGGMGRIAETLAQAVEQNGGRVLYRQAVERIVRDPVTRRPQGVETKRGLAFPADTVVANVPPWNIAQLLGSDLPSRLRRLPPLPRDGWGAFMVYLGIDGSILPPDLALHHQIIVGEPMGEGSTAFMSLSPPEDPERAPKGRRALTFSTHTDLATWWQLFESDREAYAERQADYTERVMVAAERVLPDLRKAVQLTLPGTPVTFQRFTRRAWGWVGGFPQTHLLRTWGPKLAPGLWMVGDSIFPGQSTAAVALGGLRVAEGMLAAIGAGRKRDVRQRPVSKRGGAHLKTVKKEVRQ
jgi:C-3',4' desaturase CrtD